MIARVVIETLQIKVLLLTVTVQDLLPEFVQYGNMTLMEKIIYLQKYSHTHCSPLL